MVLFCHHAGNGAARRGRSMLLELRQVSIFATTAFEGLLRFRSSIVRSLRLP